MCGAASTYRLCNRLVSGLSPRVWGSPAGSVMSVVVIGSIPTCVGQPCRLALLATSQTVYPHVCGAAIRIGLLFWVRRGLSPRVWGSRLCMMRLTLFSRSIPTCVGQPGRWKGRSRREWVYPHVCGAALPFLCQRFNVHGLSPRVWGSPWTKAI